MENIRNFVIIAHIDHGKSTLADRLLEVTKTVEVRRMRAQYLDQLDLERERGITIKMAPVRMHYKTDGKEYILNLIDTPGHSDFSYEVSRALNAVEGAILLVDATKGIQAQTLSNFRNAQKAGLKIVGAVNKIDVIGVNPDKTILALAELLKTEPENIFKVSGKTGEGVAELLKEVIRVVPAPTDVLKNGVGRALIFDSLYDEHKGILAYVRVFDGEFSGQELVDLVATKNSFRVKEVGCFMPEIRAVEKLSAGEIGYIATGFKEPALVRIGDTMLNFGNKEVKDKLSYALPGYRDATPTVFISFYPDGNTKFEDLEKAFGKLRLTDAALFLEPDANEALGRGMKVGLLGQLHFEITSARLSREFGLEFLTSFPSIAYRVKVGGVEKIIREPHAFPDKADEIWEPMIDIEILVPQIYLQKVLSIQSTYVLDIAEIHNVGDNLLITGKMPLAELIRDFDDQLKSVSAGYASFSYELSGERKTDAERLDILVMEEVVPALTRIVRKTDTEREARATVERLRDLLPKAQFSQAIQAKVGGRIIARETITASKKQLGNFGKNGGDVTRKMKLWRKQKRGKERLQERGKVSLSPEIFREILKK